MEEMEARVRIEPMAATAEDWSVDAASDVGRRDRVGGAGLRREDEGPSPRLVVVLVAALVGMSGSMLAVNDVRLCI